MSESLRTKKEMILQSAREIGAQRYTAAEIDQLRRRLLAAQGIELTGDLGLSGLQAGVDDVLDAAAVAWTARRLAGGKARRLPAEPERFSDQIDCAIWT